jgi:hypothetical protein
MAEVEFKGKVRRARKAQPVLPEAIDRWREGVEIVEKGGIEYRVSTMSKPRESVDHRIFQDHKRLCHSSGGFIETDNDLEEIRFHTPIEEYKKRKLAEEAKFKNQDLKPYAGDGLIKGNRSSETFEERPMTAEDLLAADE